MKVRMEVDQHKAGMRGDDAVTMVTFKAETGDALALVLTPKEAAKFLTHSQVEVTIKAAPKK